MKGVGFSYNLKIKNIMLDCSFDKAQMEVYVFKKIKDVSQSVLL